MSQFTVYSIYLSEPNDHDPKRIIMVRDPIAAVQYIFDYMKQKYNHLDCRVVYDNWYDFATEILADKRNKPIFFIETEIFGGGTA